MIGSIFAVATAALMALVAVPAHAAFQPNAMHPIALTANALTANALTANALSSLGRNHEGTPSSSVRFAIDGIELPALAR